MLRKDDLIEAMALECRILQHLHAKLPREDWEATLSYRPSEKQRSTLELLRYLAMCGIGATAVVLEGSWDAWKRHKEPLAEMTGEEFPAAVDRQIAGIRELLAPLSDQALLDGRVKKARGDEMNVSQALYDMPIRWLNGYRMQLFLYAKALGAEIDTPDCWYGVSRGK